MMLAEATKLASNALHPAGPQAERIAHLTWAFIIVCVIVWVLTIAFAFAAVARRPALEPAQATPPQPLDPTRERKLHFAVNVAVVITAIILFVLLICEFTTARSIHQFAHQENAINITLIGHQWWWEIHYDDVDASKTFVTANEMHIPIGRPVKVFLNSADVIHSFWIPNLNGKKDLVPGHSIETWIQADSPGQYWGQCAEYCGYEHAKMRLLVVADKQADFDAWLTASRAPAPFPSDPTVKRGLDVFLMRQCSSCHGVVGTPAGGRLGPDLTHVASRFYLASGSIPNTPGNLAGWMIDPQRIKPGVHMSQNTLEPEELRSLLEFLLALK